jgi:hypothetical protein
MDVPRSRYYLAVALGLAVMVAVVYGGAFWLIHRTPRGGQSVSTPAVSSLGAAATQSIPANVTVVPIPTIDAQPFPTPIYGASPSNSKSTVPWTVTKMVDTQLNRPYWMAPPDVVDQVRRDYQAIDDYHREHIFNSTSEDMKRFFVEPMLQITLKSQQDEASHGEARGEPELVHPDLQILGFSADGSKVQVAQEVHGETIPVYQLSTHQLIRIEHLPVGAAVSTLVYDSMEQHWKMIESRFVPGPPGLQ